MLPFQAAVRLLFPRRGTEASPGAAMDAHTCSCDGGTVPLPPATAQDARDVSYDLQQHGSAGRCLHDTPKPCVRRPTWRYHCLRQPGIQERTAIAPSSRSKTTRTARVSL